MFQKILARILLVLPLIGLVPCVAHGVELSMGQTGAEILVSQENDFSEKYNWVFEQFEELEEDEKQKESFNHFDDLNSFTSSHSFRKDLGLWLELSLLEAQNPRFPSLYIANCTYRL